MKHIASLLLLVALPAAAGLTDLDNPGPSVTSVQIRQRYPWNGLVDVDVAFEGNADSPPIFPFRFLFWPGPERERIIIAP